MGIHVSIAGSVDLAVDRALEVGCVGTFQIFTCSPRRWAARPLEETEIDLFRGKLGKYGYVPFAHMPYMPNLASPDDSFYDQSVDVLVRELKRCDQLGVFGLVLHFGSFLESDFEKGESKMVSACITAIKKTEETSVRLLLENSAGGSGSIGSKFETIGKVLQEINVDDRTGLCLDTCHAFAGGYDITSPEEITKVLDDLDSEIGLEKVFLIHANDSKEGLGEGKDRHEHIGLGKIGVKGFRAIMESPRITGMPVVLETPIDDMRNDVQNVAVMKRIAGI